MADQASFDKPDGTSNYSSEVWETVRANVRAAAALLPGSRTNPGVGALFRSAPSAGELLLEEATNAAGSTKATVFDSRTKANVASPVFTGQPTVQGGGGGGLNLNDTSTTSYSFVRWLSNGSYVADFVQYSPSHATLAGVAGFNNTGGLRVFTNGTERVRINPAGGDPVDARTAAQGTEGIIVANGGAFVSVRPNSSSGANNGMVQAADAAVIFSAAGGIETGAFCIAPWSATPSGLRLTAAGELTLTRGSFRLDAAAPSLIHRTGGQSVGEVSFALSGAAVNRGEVSLVSRKADGTLPVTAVGMDGYSDGSGGGYLQGWNAAGGVISAVYCNSNLSGQIYYLVPSGSRHLFVGGNIEPGSDNSTSCGASGQRWSAVWAANGTIQTSDARDKTDIQPIDPAKAFAFVSSLQPIVFRWLVGGRKVEQVPEGFDELEVEVEEEYTEQATEPATEPVSVERVREVVEIEAGRAVLRQVSETVIEQHPLGQWIDVVDAAGQPVLQPTGERREVGRGRNKRIEQVMVPRRHFVPELRPVEVKRTRTVKRIEQRPRYKQVVTDEAGRRYHAGLIAQHVRECLTAAGLDQAGQALGLWVQDNAADPDSPQSLRPDQFIPLLVAAMQHVAARLAKVEG